MPARITYRHILIALIAFAGSLRLAGLEISPPGFFYDEATGAAHSMCYQQTGADLFGQRDLFSQVDFQGFQSAPFLMGGAVWTSIFGVDAGGFRSFVAFAGVLAVLGVHCLARELSRDRDYALWAMALAACMPWAFASTRISWDAPLGVTLLIWGLVLAYRYGQRDARRWQEVVGWLGAGALLTLASYTYSPLRLSALLMVLLLPCIRWQPRAVILLVFGLGNIAVLQYYQDPDFVSRARLLALTSDDVANPYRDLDVLALIPAYLSQMASHLSPSFLLGPGDANLRHVIPTHGVLDWVSFTGLLIGAFLAIITLARPAKADPSHLKIATIGLLGILAGITPAALTWDSIPHALRSLGAWPFMALLAAWGLTAALRSQRLQWLQWLGASSLAVLFFHYAYSYFVTFPPAAQWWFDVQIVEQIRSTGTYPEHYQSVVRAYYRMAEFGESCQQVRASLGATP